MWIVGSLSAKMGIALSSPTPTPSTAGADHLSYFALLGRISGLALFYRETLDASWTVAFLKAAFGYTITFDDLRSADPVLHDSQANARDVGGRAEWLLHHLCSAR